MYVCMCVLFQMYSAKATSQELKLRQLECFELSGIPATRESVLLYVHGDLKYRNLMPAKVLVNLSSCPDNCDD